MTQSTRMAHLSLADNRALEEQMERHNPVNPKNTLHNRREKVLRNVGAGATPSMGLSQFRGGGECESDSDEEASAMGESLGKHLYGLHGGAFHRSFAKGVMKGGGFFDSIKNAFDPSKNGVGNAFNKVKNEFTNKDSNLAREFTNKDSILRAKVIPIGAKVAQVAQPFLDMGVPGLGTAINTGFKAANYANQGAKAFGYGRRRTVSGGRMDGAQMAERHEQAMRAGPQGLSVKEMRAQHNASEKRDYQKEHPIMSRVGEYGMKGVKGFRDLAIEHGTKVGVPQGLVDVLKKTKEMTGEGKTGAYEGKGKKRRTPASANDGRRKRAEIVKRVMAEQGLKMIEASKYVKQHGLY